MIKVADSETGKVAAKDMEAHTFVSISFSQTHPRDAINVVKYVNENILVTGDDIGIVKVQPIFVFFFLTGRHGTHEP